MADNSWVSTYVDYNGFKVTVTQEGKTAETALATLIELLSGTDAKPWLDRNNVASLPDKITPSEPTSQMIDDAFEKEGVKLDDGTNYLGVKKFMKAGDVKAGDSFDVLVSSYSFDGDTIKFFNDGQYAVAEHKMTGTWLETFEEIFKGWKPKIGEGIVLTNPRLLYIVCSGAKSTGNPYQNIKAVKE